MVINNGEHGAKQTVYHIHIHVMGGRQMGKGLSQKFWAKITIKITPIFLSEI